MSQSVTLWPQKSVYFFRSFYDRQILVEVEEKMYIGFKNYKSQENTVSLRCIDILASYISGVYYYQL